MLFKREILKYCNSKNSLVVHFEFWGINRLNTNKKKNTLWRCTCLKIFFLKTSQIFCKVFMFLFNFFINCKILCWTRGRKKLFFLNLFINIRFKWKLKIKKMKWLSSIPVKKSYVKFKKIKLCFVKW